MSHTKTFWEGSYLECAPVFAQSIGMREVLADWRCVKPDAPYERHKCKPDAPHDEWDCHWAVRP